MLILLLNPHFTIYHIHQQGVVYLSVGSYQVAGGQLESSTMRIGNPPARLFDHQRTCCEVPHVEVGLEIGSQAPHRHPAQHHRRTAQHAHGSDLGRYELRGPETGCQGGEVGRRARGHNCSAEIRRRAALDLLPVHVCPLASPGNEHLITERVEYQPKDTHALARVGDDDSRKRHPVREVCRSVDGVYDPEMLFVRQPADCLCRSFRTGRDILFPEKHMVWKGLMDDLLDQVLRPLVNLGDYVPRSDLALNVAR
mmetsp:Transcript_8843/g.19421  ORF Transcript_8843/g.19421 Transcript_8843/m.19421 type:complete len:254 (+) Transcript_8843:33-794(+)